MLMGISMKGKFPEAENFTDAPDDYVWPRSFTEVVFRMHRAVQYIVRV